MKWTKFVDSEAELNTEFSYRENRILFKVFNIPHVV